MKVIEAKRGWWGNNDYIKIQKQSLTTMAYIILMLFVPLP